MLKTTYNYPDNWVSIKKQTLRKVSRCVNNPTHKNRKLIVHHLKYKRSRLRRLLGIFLLHNPFQASVSGYEIPGWDIVPVCEHCHENSYGKSLNKSSVHYTKDWIQKGGLNNRQILSKTWELRLKFWILWLLK
jgi:hypothetical protein